MLTAKQAPREGTNTQAGSVPKDPLSTIASARTRIGKVRGNVKFSYLVAA